MTDDFQTLRIVQDGAIVRVTIDNPPMNLIDTPMIADLDKLGLALVEDTEAKVVIFDSANPDFFIAHADLGMFLPDAPPPAPRSTESIHEILNRFHTLPQATIGVLEGRAIGGGAEVLMTFDMIFAARSRATLGMFETALGTIPGAGGTQRLPRLTGRGRALEIILGSDEFDADDAERYGWINRALDPDELRPYVDNLARRIASCPLEAIKAAKNAVNAAELPLDEGLAAEGLAQANCFQETAGRPSRMGKFLELGGQQAKFELTQMRDALTQLGDD